MLFENRQFLNDVFIINNTCIFRYIEDLLVTFCCCFFLWSGCCLFCTFPISILNFMLFTLGTKRSSVNVVYRKITNVKVNYRKFSQPVISTYSLICKSYMNYQSIDHIQNRAIRYCLGVHRFAPILAIHGDIGWIPSQYRLWINMVR